MASPDLGLETKDMSKSCIFDFPDRPVRPIPPTDGGGNPLPDYPYSPIDDWPPLPPLIFPVPGIDPHPNPTGIPTMAPVATLIDSRPFYVEGEELGIPWTEGIFFTGANPYNITWGLGIAHILLSKKFAAQAVCGPLLLAETGHALEPSTSNIYCASGTVVYLHDYSHGQRVAYFLYFAQYANVATLQNFVAFAPCPITLNGGTGVPPNQIGTGFITLPAGMYPSFLPSPLNFSGLPPASNMVTKILSTGAGFLISGGSINDFFIG